jgi:hypothetical protein
MWKREYISSTDLNNRSWCPSDPLHNIFSSTCNMEDTNVIVESAKFFKRSGTKIPVTLVAMRALNNHWNTTKKRQNTVKKNKFIGGQ